MLINARSSPLHDLIMDGERERESWHVFITEPWVGQEDGVNLSLICPPQISEDGILSG